MLLVSLIVLAVVTVISTSLMDNATLEERMSADLVAGSKVLQAAELALNEAEAWLAGHVVIPQATVQNTEEVNVWLPQSLLDEGNHFWWSESGPDWWDEHGEIAATPLTGYVAARFIIEELARETIAEDADTASDLPEHVFYRITVHSAVEQENTGLLLQVTYGRILYSPDIAAGTGFTDEQLQDEINAMESGVVTGRLSWRRLRSY